MDLDYRENAARELARCHRVHLLEELEKAADLLAARTVEGISFEQHVRGQLAELETVFPGLADEAAEDFEHAPLNLMKVWYETYIEKQRGISYADTSFKLMNVFFLERIRFIRDPSEASRRRFSEVVMSQMKKSRFAERGQTFLHILSTENGLVRLIETRFAAVGLGPPEAYRALLETMSEAMSATRVQYIHDIAVAAQARSDRLLRNILPKTLAEELREDDTPPPPLHYESATIVFTDFVGFTKAASRMSPVDLVRELDEHFRVFDAIIDSHGLEKLKTIGDGYMFAGGIPETTEGHALACVKAALEIRDFVHDRRRAGNAWGIRIGVHTGPVVAGVIGRKKFSYDVWGDTVNVASRMESSGDPGQVNLSEETRLLVRDRIQCEELGPRRIKNRGTMKMFVARSVRSG